MIQIGRRTDLDHDDMLWVGIRQVKGECGSWTLRSPCREAAQFNAWLHETGQVVCNCPWDAEHWRQLPDRPAGNMVVYRSLDWDEPRVIEAPDHLFLHAARSRCGRYIVSESYRTGAGPHSPLDIVVVNVCTGKHRVLVSDCGTKPHGAAWRTACPYPTSNNGFVVYNADPYDLTNVHAARVPDGFLASLD